MQKNTRNVLSWLAGLGGLIILLWYFRPADVLAAIRSVGIPGVLAWTVITIIARVLHAETTAAPLRAMGHVMRLADAFWIGWIRTFAHQVFPTAGVVAYAHALRVTTHASWSEIAMLAAPQYVLIVAALGLVGLVGTACNIDLLQHAAAGFAIAFAAMVVFSLMLTSGAPQLIGLLPKRMADRLDQTSAALREFIHRPGLVSRVVTFHALAIVLRGSRIWVLFAAVAVNLDWREALLLIAVAEASILILVTPGGLGVREGAILAGALLVGVAPEVAATVALVDRILTIGLTALLTPPAIVIIHAKKSA
ncbi:MAG: lysylphosphatidylglycerol synthase transmembrane domain-containing protein [Woeseiaceae bacterium]